MSSSPLKIVFLGTPDFAVAPLAALRSAGFNIVAVVTVADKPAGRGQQIQSSPVKQFAIEHGIDVLQPTNLKAQDFIDTLAQYKADLQFVVAFRMLPEQVWNMPRLGTYNLHASLLPRYRGAAPIQHAILHGDTETGVSTFKLQHQIDTGNVLLQEKLQISPDMSGGELHDALMQVGARLVVQTAQLIVESEQLGKPLHFQIQDDKLATHAPKIFREHCRINWQQPAAQIYNQIRGLSPYPAAFTLLANDSGTGKVLKIFKAKPLSDTTLKLQTAGTLQSDGTRILVCCNDGWIELLEVQLEGKRRMTVADFLKGVPAPQKLRLE